MTFLRSSALAAAALLFTACAADAPVAPAAAPAPVPAALRADHSWDNGTHVIHDSDYTRAVTVPCTPLGPETFILYGYEDISWQFMMNEADGVRFRTHVVTRAGGLGPKTGEVYYTTDVENEQTSFVYGGLPMDIDLVHHFNLRSRDSDTRMLVREHLRVHVDEEGNETVVLVKMETECR